jgi:type IV pilus assembly protein PilA
MTEAVNIASSAKSSVSEYIVSQNVMPADAAQAGFNSSPDTDVVTSITWDQANAAIIIAVKAIGGTIVAGDNFALFVSSTANSRVVWGCTQDAAVNPGVTQPIPAKYLPANCR